MKFEKPKAGSRDNSRERRERINYVEVQSSDHDSDDDQKHYIYSISSEKNLHDEDFHSSNEIDNTDNSFSTETILMCLPIKVIGSDGNIHIANAMIDPGSSGNFVSASLAKRLGIAAIDEEELHLSTFATDKTKIIMSEKFLISILLNNGATKEFEMNSLVVMTSPLRIIKMSESDLSYVREQSVVDLPLSKETPDILLSTTAYASLLTTDSPLEILPSGFRIQHSLVGPIIFGEGKIDKQCLRNIKIILHNKSDQTIDDCMQKLWDNEALGIIEKPTDCEDELSLQYFEQTISFENNRYVVKFHWREDMRVGLNYDQSYARLCHAVKTLQKNKQIDKYHSIIQDQLMKNIIEEVPDGQIDGEPGKRTHIPHHPVFTPDKSTKTRIVYDGSSKTETGKSLNECLYRGPVILPEIGGILLRIRTPSILISSDIEKAFLQIELSIPDRDATLFLWLRDPNLPATKSNIVTYRFTRVPFGIISSPFHLSAVIRHHLIKMNHPLLKDIHRNSYVDNIFLSAESIEEAERLYGISKKAFADCGMNLREYASNNESFNKYVVSQNEQEVPTEVKVLGLKWIVKEDCFVTKIPQAPVLDQLWTKRKILKYAAKPFDVLGLLCPIIIVMKMFLQGLWKKKYRWDQPLKSDDQEEWKTLVSTMRSTDVKIPRLLFSRTDHEPILSLHTFCDASGKAYACVSYLRIFTPANGYSVRFLFAKARLVPISGITIPKAELLAIEIGSRIQRYIRDSLPNLNIRESIIWSDSKVALMWTLSDTTTNVFVKNRCKKINETMQLHPNTSLFYVSTDINPADIASRGCNIYEFEDYKQWIEGPDFLRMNDDDWNENYQMSAIELKNREKRPDQNLSMNLVLVEEQVESRCMFPIRFEDYSSYYKIIGIISRIIYFFKFSCLPYFMKLFQIDDQKDIPHCYSDAQVILMKIAERIIIKHIQNECPPPKNIYSKAIFFTDTNGILRVKSRVPESSTNPSPRDPIYLPHNHYITKLIIMYVHTMTNHCSPLQVLSTLRQKYWLAKGRSIVKHTIKNMCFVCKRFTSNPFKLPNMHLLPPERITTNISPFTNIGLDYAGPFNIKSSTGELEKVWVILVTCLSVRAINCEFVKDLKAQTFLNFLRRFISRRGHVKSVYCDNQSTFVASNKTLTLLQKESNEFYRKMGITFKFITALSPWKGGVYERLIGLLKKCMKATIGRRLVTEDEFHTFLYECESVINQRPITYVSSDLNEIVPIRPIDFIIPLGDTGTPQFDDYEDQFVDRPGLTIDLVSLWKQQTQRLDYFWKIFYKDYVTDLMYSSKVTHKQGKLLNRTVPKKGDVVIVKNDNPNRCHWELARIIDLPQVNEPSTATVMTPNGNILDRPINLLHFLECSQWDDVDKRKSQDRKSKSDTELSRELISHHPMTTRKKSRCLALVRLQLHLSVQPWISIQPKARCKNHNFCVRYH